jgi:hypothetical protein
VSDAEFAERRLSPRYPPKVSTQISCREGTLGLGPNVALSAADLSETGLQILLSEPVERGRVVEVGLLAPGWQEEAKRLGMVMWTKPTPDGGCQVGVQLSQRLSRDALRDLCYLPEF